MLKKILIVDDNPDILLVLGGRLEANGYETLKASDAAAALKQMEADPPDLILLDILMPDMEGTVLARTLQNDPRWKQIPIVFLTALRSRGEQERDGAQVGTNIIFAKPFEFSELLETIRTLI